MSVKVSTRHVDGVTILDLSGRITLGEGSVVLRDAIRDLLAKGDRNILLNLAMSATSTAPASASWSAPSPA